MKRPKIILFDYAQTLLNEQNFNGIRGTEAVLKMAKKNPQKITADEMLKFDAKMNSEIGRYNPRAVRKYLFEIHNHNFLRYLYDYFGLEFDVSFDEIETVFWDNATPCDLTVHIKELLNYLKDVGIRTAVVSNISYSENSLKRRINTFLPDNTFEFIMASSEYVFRKPHPFIFELALKKANVMADEAWFCGDDLVCDIEGASNLGIKTIWYKGAYKGDMDRDVSLKCTEIDDWMELKNILSAL